MKKTIVKELYLDEISIVDSPAQEYSLICMEKSEHGSASNTLRGVVRETLGGLLYNEKLVEEVMEALDMNYIQYEISKNVKKNKESIDNEVTANKIVNICKKYLLDNNSKYYDIMEKQGQNLEKGKEVEVQDFTAIQKSLTDISKSNEVLKKSNEDLVKELALFKSVSGLTGDEKSHYDTMGDEDKTLFIAKSKEEKAVEIKKFNDNKEVIATINGMAITKNHSKAEQTLAKAFQSQEIAIAKMKADNDAIAIQKSANTNLGHLNGTDEAKVALMKALGVIEDPKQKEDVLAILKSKNESFEEFYKTKGHVGDEAFEAGGNINDSYQDKLVKFCKSNSLDINKPTDIEKFDMTDEAQEFFKSTK